MDRQEAVESLQLIRRVIGQTRDESILQNWGVVWIIHGVLTALTCALTNYLLLERGETRIWLYFGIWSVHSVAVVLTILILKKRGGAKTFVEKQIWGTWITYLLACYVVAGINEILGESVFHLAPLVAVLAAVSFSWMALTLSPKFFVMAALFVATSLAMARWLDHQFYILGAAWLVALVGQGSYYVRERARMEAREAEHL